MFELQFALLELITFSLVFITFIFSFVREVVVCIVSLYFFVFCPVIVVSSWLVPLLFFSLQSFICHIVHDSSLFLLLIIIIFSFWFPWLYLWVIWAFALLLHHSWLTIEMLIPVATVIPQNQGHIDDHLSIFERSLMLYFLNNILITWH